MFVRILYMREIHLKAYLCIILDTMPLKYIYTVRQKMVHSWIYCPSFVSSSIPALKLLGEEIRTSSAIVLASFIKSTGFFSYSFQSNPIISADRRFLSEGTIIHATTLILKDFAISTISPKSERDAINCVTQECGFASIFFWSNDPL